MPIDKMKSISPFNVVNHTGMSFYGECGKVVLVFAQQDFKAYPFIIPFIKIGAPVHVSSYRCMQYETVV
jgi:hypothetical protein